MVDAVMKTQDMKPLLIKSKEEPVSAAIGMTKEGEGIILLNKVAGPRQMLGLLRQSAGKAGVKLDSPTLRFGRAEIHTDEKSSLVKFIVNKEGTEKLRKTLQLRVREIQFQTVEILVDEALEQDDPTRSSEQGGLGTNEDPTTEDPLLDRTKELDKLELVIKQSLLRAGTNTEARNHVIEAAKALKAGRECVSNGDGPGAIVQIKQAMLALQSLGTGTQGGQQSQWKRPEGPSLGGEQRPEPEVTMGQRKRHALVPPERQRPRSDQVQHAVSRRLLTGEELMQRIGKRPKSDKVFGLFKQSTRFKQVLTALKPIDDFMNQSCEQIDKTSFQQAQQQMLVAGNKALGPLEEYRKKLSKDHDDLESKWYKAERGSEQYKKLQAQVTRLDLSRKRLAQDKKHLGVALESYQNGDLTKTWDLIKSDPGFEKVKGKLSIGQAIQIKSCGISFSDVDLDNLKDSSLDKNNSKEEFGSGGINSVSKLSYNDGSVKVFKPMQDSRGNPATAVLSGISEDNPHYENRNITSHVIGDVLGTSVIPKATIGLHNGRIGLMMDLAPGKEPLQTRLAYNKNPTPGKIPGLQNQLMDLEWCDLISGQMDRHHKNYLVDLSSEPPKVTGIDNDLAFGPLTGKVETLQSMAGYNGCGKPKLINRKTFEKLMATDFDRDMKPALQGRITFSEIDATQKRFEEMQKHAQSLDPTFIVDDWTAWRLKQDDEELTATQYLMQDKNSLFGRDFSDLGK